MTVIHELLLVNFFEEKNYPEVSNDFGKCVLNLRIRKFSVFHFSIATFEELIK